MEIISITTIKLLTFYLLGITNIPTCILKGWLSLPNYWEKGLILLTLQKTSPTVLNNYEEITSKYILITLLVSDKETKRICMNLVQEELFVYSRTVTTNDIKVRQNLANTQINANTIIYSRHYAFSLREDYAIIGAGKMCSTGVGKKSLVSRPKPRGLIFFEKGSYTAKYPEFSIL